MTMSMLHFCFLLHMFQGLGNLSVGLSTSLPVLRIKMKTLQKIDPYRITWITIWFPQDYNIHCLPFKTINLTSCQVLNKKTQNAKSLIGISLCLQSRCCWLAKSCYCLIHQKGHLSRSIKSKTKRQINVPCAPEPPDSYLQSCHCYRTSRQCLHQASRCQKAHRWTQRQC